MKCRHCTNELKHTFVDLGFAPPSNAYLTESSLNASEKYFPLRVKVCEKCWLVQTEDYSQASELFDDDYAYLSSTSSTWLEHCRLYAGNITEKLELDEKSLVVELAANDGYLLVNFRDRGIPSLGIEPTGGTADIAEEKGLDVIREFFGVALAGELVGQGRRADLIIGNNVYAHVPDINDFTRGMKMLLKEEGTITLEFPHLLNLIRFRQFDTIYHEHYSYLSLTAVRTIFSACGLRIYDVEKLDTHGGSLRVYGCHQDSARTEDERVAALLQEEQAFGLQGIDTYTGFQESVNSIKNDFLAFLLDARKKGKKVVAYGAAAKGNTLLNYAGVKPDLLPAVCDGAPAKQGKYLPGSHIPIHRPEELPAFAPDYVLVLPWNIANEIIEQYRDLHSKGVEFVCAIPELRML